ncbi:MAG: hypothetical protein R3362_00095 [Rhodothermales bacterium]|nr:hypothetical protein [Rhodothermales bacterium]
MKKVAALALIVIGGALILYKVAFFAAPGTDPAAMAAAERGLDFPLPVFGTLAVVAGFALLAFSHYQSVRQGRPD